MITPCSDQAPTTESASSAAIRGDHRDLSDALGLIVNSSAYQAFAPAYEGATCLHLRVVPASLTGNGLLTNGKSGLTPCRLLRVLPTARDACETFARGLVRCAAAKNRLCSATCFAGFRIAAVPVFNGPTHVATLLAGPASLQPRTPPNPAGIEGALGKLDPSKTERLTRAWAAVPLVDRPHFLAAGQLLACFARSLEERLPAWLLANSASRPLAVLRAKDYLAKHATDAVRLPEVARHVGLGVQRFCTVFKQATGFTFTHFLARLRVEKAKALLPDQSRRIADIAFESGFDSIPTFNRTFKSLVGVPPTDYRQAFRSEAKF